MYKKKLRKKRFMENIQSSDIQKRILEKRDPSSENEIDPETFIVREYKPRFLRVTAYCLPEDSTIHCADEKTLVGRAGDFYVSLDQVQEFVLDKDTFKKLFLIKLDV
jgi:hypothetical protein